MLSPAYLTTLSPSRAEQSGPVTDVSVIILTLNEATNLPYCIHSVKGWACQIIVVDSFSTDGTTVIAMELGAAVYQHKFENYSTQRNWALSHVTLQSHWVFFLDADEWLTGELKQEISKKLIGNPIENGFLIRRRFIWMGKWVKRGYYPLWLLRLFRNGHGRCEARGINEHIVVEGAVTKLKSDFIHEDRKSLWEWNCKHTRYAEAEAQQLLERQTKDCLPERLLGTPPERRRWLRQNVYLRLPTLLRPALYFLYRLLVRGGILEGPEAVIYHFLHALWFHLLIDLRYKELAATTACTKHKENADSYR
jgi:glycosyltransferase involved in cell wall biosynthesis